MTLNNACLNVVRDQEETLSKNDLAQSKINYKGYLSSLYSRNKTVKWPPAR